MKTDRETKQLYAYSKAPGGNFFSWYDLLEIKLKYRGTRLITNKMK